MFFRPYQQQEDHLYAQLRDDQKYSKAKDQIEYFWSIYAPYADNTFIIQAQKQNQFKQRWWELILAAGLIKSGTSVCKKTTPEGPDIMVDSNPTIFIEAIAPTRGSCMSKDQLPELEFRKNKPIVKDLPKRQFLLRLTSAFREKSKKYELYRKNGLIGCNDPYIIAISSCDLSDYGDLMDFPVSAAFSIVAGAGDLVLSENGNFVQYQPTISKSNLSSVEANSFLNLQYSGVSGVIYSSSNVLNCPNCPQENFILFRNPNAQNKIPDGIFKIETWDYNDLDNSWHKHK